MQRLMRIPQKVACFLVLAWLLLIHSASFFSYAADSVPSDRLLYSIIADWLHFPLYGTLAVLVFVALRSGASSEPRRSTYAWAFVLTMLGGVSDELHQAVTPWRNGDPADLVTNAFAAAGLLWCVIGYERSVGERTLATRFGVTALVTLSCAIGASLLATLE